MTWSEQQKIEFAAPEYLRNVIRIITETGLRIYQELAPMKKGAGRHPKRTAGEILSNPDEDARSRCEPVHFPTEDLLLSRVGRNPDQFATSLPHMDAKLE